jgi:MFS family permease
MGRNRALWLLWGGEFASRVGESFFQITLLWYLVEVSGSKVEVGLVTMFGYLPALVVGIGAGVWVDRLDYRRAMLASNALRGLAALAIPLCYALDALPTWLLAALAFLVASFSAFFNPARDAAIPLLAGPHELLSANSLVQTAWQFSLLVGPFLAAMALPFMPTISLFVLVSLAFWASLGVLVPLPRLRPSPAPAGTDTPAPAEFEAGGEIAAATPGGAAAPNAPQGAGARGFGAEFRAGLGFLLAERRVFWLWLIAAVNNFFLMGPVIVGMPIYVKEHLAGSGSDFAIIEGTYAGGMIVSTWLVARFAGRWNPARLMFWALIYDGLTYVPMLWITSVEATVALILIHSLGIPAITVTRLTALQRIVKPEVRGRIFSYFHLAVSGMTALSIGTVGIVLVWLPVNALFAAIGLACAATGMAGLLLPHFRGRRAGELVRVGG